MLDGTQQGGVIVRGLFAFLSMLLLAQCATDEQRQPFYAGRSANALVIIGVAESPHNRDPAYSMLWRRLDDAGAFTAFDDSNAFQAHTNAEDSVRVHGIPGEFTILEVPPGAYALDGVFATVRENRVTYFAQGVLAGPERPAFEVGPGEAVYLGIWEMDIDGAVAITHPWRLDAGDVRAVLRAAHRDVGEVRPREARMRAVACQPHRINDMTQRQIC
jgi:hypothetical protein